jgi:coenzyme F420-reducing hydrogenase gamma subunit
MSSLRATGLSCAIDMDEPAPCWRGERPRIAVFSLTGCEGCALSILELENELLDVLERVELVNFREAMSEASWEIDIGFVDGAVSTPEDEQEVKRYREASRTLVAIGACACLGGVNTLKNYQNEREYRRLVYGDRASYFPTTAARPISAVVKVDYELPGCPMVGQEFLRFMTCVLSGRRFQLPDYPVCVECKKRGVLCLYERGEVCLGPLTRGGCNAICPAYGGRCEACRGLVSREALQAGAMNLQELYGLTVEGVLADLRRYGAHQEAALP